MAKKKLPLFVGTASVAGRILLCALFLAAAAGSTASSADRLAALIAAKGILGPTAALVGCVSLLVLGSASVIVGYRTRIGALLLLSFLVATTCYFHGFTLWTLLSAEARQEQLFHLAANLSMIGAMLFLVANGAGEMSFDARRR